ncbi:PAS domain S-box-containing protein [Desulfobaculum xiamenense]|uniref:PAS domain S-box-containing protein n=1 Tax=Desulfobaculum xiamenense TaxID=995050 RepID=A0A846QS91_9BACT|nr:histidine kinase dimerization/phosphoacceptor domain -containing protein [Desulfobaculum xiamenense]NJB69402.1 PAS domain S-box-containing protein [Desulfobaculum xiamenense]
MEDLIFEPLRAVLCLCILIMFARASRNPHLAGLKGWRFVLSGTALLTFGSFMDITDHFPRLYDSLTINGIRYAEVLEEFVGYLVGCVLLALGFLKLLPAMEDSFRLAQEQSLLRERFRSITEVASDYSFICNVQPDGSIVPEWFSPSFAELCGHTPDQPQGIGLFTEMLHPDDRFSMAEWMDDMLAGRKSECECRIVTPDGQIKWLRQRSTPQRRNPDGPTTRIVGAVNDITAQKTAEEAMLRSLAENRLLLQEVHHRVKNNLQIICSLLDVAHTRIRDPEVLSVCGDIQTKVQSMALVHSQLYEADRMDSIDIATYSRKLFERVAAMYDSRRITPTFDARPVFLPLDKAIPFGLALNELLTNTFRHAFNGSDDNRLTLRIRHENGTVIVDYSDNGHGLPPEVDTDMPKTMGLRLLHGLVLSHLGGTLSCAANGDTRFHIEFPHENSSMTTDGCMRD